MRQSLRARVFLLIVPFLALIAPHRAAAEYWCQKEDLTVLGVTPDGSIVTYSHTPGGGADCDTVELWVRDKSAQGKTSLEIVSSAEYDCRHWKVKIGKPALTKADQKLDMDKLADKIVKTLGATPLAPSKRTDLFTVHTVTEMNEHYGENETRAFLRWDGEPVSWLMLGNYAMGVGKVRLLEHPSSPGLFVEFTSTEPGKRASECGSVRYTFYISPADITAHEQLIQARAAAVKDPKVAEAELRQRIRSGNKDPLLARRLARTEIAAGTKKGKPDSCQVRTRRPLGMTEAGALVFTARVELPPGQPCTTEERVGVEDAAGKTLLRVERRLPNQCDAAARGFTVYEGAAELPQDKVAAAANLDAVAAIVAARYSYTALSPVVGAAVPTIEASRDGVKFLDGGALLLRQKARTTSPAAVYRVQRLGHARSRNQVLRYVSLPPWRWSAGSVCEDEVEDFAVLSAARQAELAAAGAVKADESLSAAAVTLQKYLDSKAARDAFLERATNESICNEKLPALYKALKSRKSAELRAFAAELCKRNRDDDCHEIDEPCGQTTE